MRIAFVLAALGLVLSGCVARDATSGEKAAALAAHPARVDGKAIGEWLRRRSALLICGAQPTAVEQLADGWQVVTVATPAGIGLASAVPIGASGCFLTSAHNLARRPIYVCVVTAEGMRWAPATVIDAGEAGDEPDDLALLRADLVVDAGFTLASALPRAGELVYAAGRGVSAGAVLGVRRCDDRRGEAVIYHDAPTRSGDSGGAVVDAMGRLVGVTSRITSSWHGWRVAAVRPSAALMARALAP